jgi:hypothetical protein
MKEPRAQPNKQQAFQDDMVRKVDTLGHQMDLPSLSESPPPTP